MFRCVSHGAFRILGIFSDSQVEILRSRSASRRRALSKLVRPGIFYLAFQHFLISSCKFTLSVIKFPIRSIDRSPMSNSVTRDSFVGLRLRSHLVDFL